MELALIFAVGWVSSHVFGEKRDEYEHSQDSHRDKYMRRLAAKHPHWSKARQSRYLQNAARRNAAGHLAYLFRHGWSSTFNDFVDGWKKAKDAHEEWKAEHPKDKPSRWQTLKAGWGDQAKRRQKTTADRTPKSAYVPDPEKPTPPKPTTDETDRTGGTESADDSATGPQLTDDLTRSAQIYTWPGTRAGAPINPAGSTNRSTTMEFNFDRTRTEMNGINEFTTRTLSVVEQIIADAMAGENLSRDTETMGHLASLQEALSNASAQATAVAASMTKHASGQEYANTGTAANTDYLRSS